jgi:glycosyltransferase involved in cell wall biosynthesis
MKQLKIMMLGLRSVSGSQGGVETHVLQLVRELDELGHAVEVIERKPYTAKSGFSLGREVRTTPIWSTRGQSTEALLHSILGVFYAAAKRPDILHIHAVGPALVAPLARAFGLRVVVTHHGEDYLREKWGWVAKRVLRLGEWCAARFAGGRICVSPSLSKKLSLRYGKTFHYIPNGVRAGRRTDSTDAVRRLGLLPGGYVLHVGRVVPEKRQLDLIEVVDRIGDRLSLKLALVGAADHEGAFSQAVRHSAARSSRTVLCGFQNGESLAELFNHCAVFALPSSHEGLPIALLEAMSFGCRVVASDIAANRDVGLEDSAYFPTGDLDALERAIQGSLSTCAPVDWAEKLAPFNWTRIAAETLDVYRRAAA